MNPVDSGRPLPNLPLSGLLPAMRRYCVDTQQAALTRASHDLRHWPYGLSRLVGRTFSAVPATGSDTAYRASITKVFAQVDHAQIGQSNSSGATGTALARRVNLTFQRAASFGVESNTPSSRADAQHSATGSLTAIRVSFSFAHYENRLAIATRVSSSKLGMSLIAKLAMTLQRLLVEPRHPVRIFLEQPVILQPRWATGR